MEAPVIGFTDCLETKILLKDMTIVTTISCNIAKNIFQIKLNISLGYCGEREITLMHPKMINA